MIDNNLITTIVTVTISFCTLLVVMMIYIKNKSSKTVEERYDKEMKMVELEYMRKNLEMQLYDVSKKLEENELRWKDINHLIISSQNSYEKNSYKNPIVEPNNFLKNLGIEDNRLFEIDERQVFVLTPFNDDYRRTFFTIKEVCTHLKLRCIRGDEEYVPNDIFPHILREIVKSRFVIANISGRNPNVMYELGVAHALGKPTIIVSQNFSDIPFDLNNKRIIIFHDEAELQESLRNSITDMLLNKVI